MSGMRVDHVSTRQSTTDCRRPRQRLAKLIGVDPVDGGIHPRFGTRNVILPLAHERYVEVVEVLDHPASDKAPFGQAVRARSEAGGGWLGWCIAVDDLAPLETRIGREAVAGNRLPPRRRRAALAPAGHQGPDVRPAAALLRAVGGRLAAPLDGGA